VIAHGIAPGLGWVLAACTAAIGLLAMIAPRKLAELYGLPIGARGFPFVRATGLRDIVVAGILAAAAMRRDRPELIVIAILGVVLALGDAVIVALEMRRFSQPMLAHLTGALAFVVLLESTLWP